MALGLARAGAAVVITAAREKFELEDVVAEAASIDGAGRVVPIVADVSVCSECESVVAQTAETFGRIDILVNNAARGMRFVNEGFMEQASPFWDTDPETWRMMVDTNVNGPFYMARAVMPHFLTRHWGRIVNVTINAATMRRRGFSPYGASKAALESETITWAADCAGTGVTVNCLLPGGATNTGMVPDDVGEEIKAKLLDPDIVVPPLMWLVSENADGATGGRYIATNWDKSLPPDEAGENARGRAGWPVKGA